MDLFASNVMVKADLTCLPFPADTFDVVVCCHVLGHIPNDSDALREIHRVLRPEGWTLLTTFIAGEVTKELPCEATSGWGWGELGDSVVRHYGMDIVQKLKDVGFHVQVFTPPQVIQANEWTYLRIRKEDDPILQCSKQR